MSSIGLQLDVRAIGLCTSVGHDAATACAAIRAGLSRPSPIHELMMPRLDEYGSRPMYGHAVVPITNGFASVARWLQMSRIALSDLLDQIDDNARTTLHVCLPDSSEERFAFDLRVREDQIHRHFVVPLLAALAHRWGPRAIEVHTRGRLALCSVLRAAQQELGTKADSAIILAVDSYVDAHTLEWLNQADRLKHDGNPVGLTPGEAAVAICVTAAGRSPAGARMARLTLAGEAHVDAEHDSCGRALGRVLAGLCDLDVAELYTDLNGEEWRAHAYTLALLQLPDAVRKKLETYHVAAEIGDTGEVSVWINLALAARSYSRNYARGQAAIVAARTSTAAAAILVRQSS